MMIRLNSKYCSSLFLQIFLVLILCGSSTAAEEEAGSATNTPITEGSIITDAAANETGYYLYNPVGKTDPFKSFIVEREERSNRRCL